MFLFTFLACAPTEQEEPEPTPEATPPAEMAIELVPAQVDFGTLGLGAPATQTLTINNVGEAAVQLSALYADSESVSLDALVNVPIAPGASEEVTVTWAPEGPSSLSEQIGLLMRKPDGTLEEVPVTLTGTAAGPVMTLSAEELDFGTVDVGCTSTLSVTIGNTGNDALVLSDISLVERSELALTERGGELEPFPWTLAPNETREVQMTYAPRDNGVLYDFLQITSDDPVAPVAEVKLTASAHIEEDNSITFEVEQPQNVTALFAVNQIAVNYHTRLFDALPGFFDILNDSRAHYRLAFLIVDAGTVDGSTDYIDDTMTTDEAVAAATAMLENAGGDLDTLLQTLSNGIEENRSWLIDDEVEWEESRLSLIGINSDTEQSTGNATLYVSEYREYKDDPADILVHAIGGDYPRGCFEAEPFEMFYLAAAKTGGQFLSYCTADWTGHFATLADAILGEQQAFTLTGEPADWSIEVWVNSTRTTTGWTYDAATKGIVFEEDTYPAVGSEIRVDYIMATECE